MAIPCSLSGLKRQSPRQWPAEPERDKYGMESGPGFRRRG